MTPFYFVVREHLQENNLMEVQTRNLATQKEALESATERCKRTGVKHYVVEVIGVVEMPKPEPIITMKGD